MLFSVDRIVEETAVLVDEQCAQTKVPLALLPQGVKSGDMLFCEDGVFFLAPEETEKRREQVGELLSLLLGDGKEEV